MAWHWVKHNRVMEDYKQRFHRFKMLRFEDMYDEHNSGLKEFVRFCDVPVEFSDDVMKASSQKKNAMKKKFRSAEEWTKHIEDQVVDICGDLMKLYEYSWPVE